MAGNYVDVPSWRIPYDRDGTVGIEITTALVPSVVANSQLQNANNESAENGWGETGGASHKQCLIFPRLMDIDGGYWNNYQYVGAQCNGFEWSDDTTNGVDGTWTSFNPGGGSQASPTPINPNYRTNIWSGTLGGVRALRWTSIHTYGYGWTLLACHLYGEPTAGEDENRLEVWHPTLNQRVDPAYFDVGNVQRGSSEDIQFRIKNRSTTLTANDVRLSFEARTDTTPSVPGQFQVSSDGINFYAQRTISSIAPGAISAVYTMRRITPSNAVLSLWVLRMNVEATTGWS